MILVTGGTGFLGATLARQLIASGEDVRILRRKDSKLDLLGDLAPAADHAIGDIRDPASLQSAMRGVQRVYHAAAYVGFGGRREKAALLAINVQGTASVVDAANEAGVDRLVHVSSIAAIGRRLGQPELIDESHAWTTSKENTGYAVSKHLSEMEVHRAIAEGLDAVIVNPAVIFGVGRPGENTMAVVEKVRDGRVPAIPSGGTCVVDVEDVVAGMRSAMARGTTGERYILGGENLAWVQIFGTLAEVFDARLPRLRLSRKPAVAMGAVSEALALLLRKQPLITRETARNASSTYHYANDKARRELGCAFRSFRETAKRIAETLK